MEKIPTNPTCGDTEQEAGECGTHGWARAWTPHPRDTTHCGGKEREREKKKQREGKKKEREEKKRNQKPAGCSNTELWRGIGVTGTSTPAARGRAEQGDGSRCMKRDEEG